ncbi:MAG TPA: sulfatase-like hydrolase/transferase, partial [Bdellovibrionota bacterium]|nr:sulfatase-like hydrolase/transferase [Bdellovibrionota bacterium]
FVDQLFASPIGDRTLVVFLADHSILEDGPRDLPPVAQKDFGFRIPIILLTKNMRHPEIREVQAHQIDIAPTLAAVAGAKGEVAWLGRNLLAPGATGSPWVYWDPDGISFRSGQLLCQGRGASEPACWNLAPGQDPLFSAELEPITPPPGMTALMGDAVQASGVLIDHGRLAAPPRQSDPSH